MSLHLYALPVSARNALHVLAAYENGSVACRRHNASPTSPSIEGRGWELLWTVKFHVESSLSCPLTGLSIVLIYYLAVMALTVSPDNSFALSVSADHLIVRYDLAVSPSSPALL
jgi:ASTRA-associated protein 1